jgi:hypothetical protein
MGYPLGCGGCGILIRGVVRTLFCDETGDPGRDFRKGASRFFAVCMLSTPTGSEHERFIAKQAEIRDELQWRGEFKWTKMHHDLRMEYLRRSLPTLSAHHSVLWEKPDIQWAENAPKELLMMQTCMRRLNPELHPCRLIIDGERNRRRAREIRGLLGINEVRFIPSHTSPYLQLADILVGFQVAEAAGKIRDLPIELRTLRRFRSDCG